MLQSVSDVFPGNWCHQVEHFWQAECFSVLLLVDELKALLSVYTFCADSLFPRPKGNKSPFDLLTNQKSVQVNYPTKTLSVHFALKFFRT